MKNTIENHSSKNFMAVIRLILTKNSQKLIFQKHNCFLLYKAPTYRITFNQITEGSQFQEYRQLLVKYWYAIYCRLQKAPTYRITSNQITEGSYVSDYLSSLLCIQKLICDFNLNIYNFYLIFICGSSTSEPIRLIFNTICQQKNN